ncbi:MAG TPA: sensor domain-containing diguanylate cyclase [Candidatus Dormibacteraeota bacterium]
MIYTLAASLLVLVIAVIGIAALAWRLREAAWRLEEAVEEAAASRDQAQVLLSVAEAVNSSLSLEDVIDVALSRCVHLGRAPAGAFYMARQGRLEMTREAVINIAPRARGAVRKLDADPLRSALQDQRPTVHALHEDDAPALDSGGHPSHVLLVPVRRAGQLMGAIEIYLLNDPIVPRRLLDLLQGIAAQAATAIRHAQIYREQEESSLTDELTRLPNRRYLGQRFLQERQRARRGHRPLGVLMLDIDHFKTINDTYGHLVGDAVLAELATIIRAAIRDSDVAARYGGEEFAVIVQETPLDGAMRLAGRIRSAVEHAVFPNDLKLTVSIGVASTSDAEQFAELFERADHALYEAKRAGRNRVQAAVEHNHDHKKEAEPV